MRRLRDPIEEVVDLRRKLNSYKALSLYRDTVKPISVSVKTIVQSMPDGEDTIISFDNAVVSNESDYWDLGVSTINILRDGLFHIEAGAVWSVNSSGIRRLQIMVGPVAFAGDQAPPAADLSTLESISRILPLSAGDTLAVRGYQDSGASLTILPEPQTFRVVRYLQPL